MEHEADSVVIPLVPMLSDPTTEAMLRMLVNREAIVVSRVSDPGTVDRPACWQRPPGRLRGLSAKLPDT